MLGAHSSHLFLPHGTYCLAHCPGRLGLQCSCFAGGNLKYSDTTYRSIFWYTEIYVALELLAAGAVGVSVVSVLAWPDCPSLHVCQGIPPCSCSPVPGALSLLCCWNRDCVALLSLQRMDTAGHSTVSWALGLLAAGWAGSCVLAAEEQRWCPISHCTESLRKGKLFLLLLRTLWFLPRWFKGSVIPQYWCYGSLR